MEKINKVLNTRTQRNTVKKSAGVIISQKKGPDMIIDNNLEKECWKLQTPLLTNNERQNR